jgi:hypothetical protein
MKHPKSLHEILHHIEHTENTRMQKRATAELIAALDEMRSAIRSLDRDCVTLSEVIGHVEPNDGPMAQVIREHANAIRTTVAGVHALRKAMDWLGEEIDRGPM